MGFVQHFLTAEFPVECTEITWIFLASLWNVNSLSVESEFCNNGNPSHFLQSLEDVFRNCRKCKNDLACTAALWCPDLGSFCTSASCRWCQVTLLKLDSQRQSEILHHLLSVCLMAEAMEDQVAYLTPKIAPKWNGEQSL